MKKTLLIALAGMMLFAFTQCGNKGAKGSKEFQDNKELFENLEKAITESKTCDELQEAALAVVFMGLAIDKNYPDDEKMTESEKAEIEKLGSKIEELMNEQVEKLGCDEEEE